MSNEELVYLYQNGDKQALDKLIEQNRGMVNKVVNKFYTEGTSSIDREDLEQEGYIGLITAVNKYNLNNEKKAQFITYAVLWIYQKISRFIKNKSTNNQLSLNAPTGESGGVELIDLIKDLDYSFENIEERIYNQQLRKELEEVMSKYNTLKEISILKLRYNWDNNKSFTYKEIGELFNVTGAMIINYEHHALGKIRRSPWGTRKAREVYGVKKNQSIYSIPGTIESINFAQRYL